MRHFPRHLPLARNLIPDPSCAPGDLPGEFGAMTAPAPSPAGCRRANL